MITIEPGFTLLYQAVVGSQAYGMATKDSDTDRMGVCLQPLSRVVGHQGFEQYVDDKNSAGQTTIYALDKWMKLVLKGNPTVTEILFSHPDMFEHIHPLWHRIRDKRHEWISKRTIKAHLGYLTAQRARMKLNPDNHHGRGNPRQALVSQFGYDTKFAAHALRLAWMGQQMAELGYYRLPLSDTECNVLLGVRNGHATVTAMDELLDAEIALLESKLATTMLPNDPNYALADDIVSDIYMENWYEPSN